MKKYDWYWEKGLHDAVVTGIESAELPYDYTQRKPLRNYFEIRLNSKPAMFDTTIKALRFYNFKLKKEVEDIVGSWWVNDEVYEVGDKYGLIIHLGKPKKEMILEIIFEKAEIVR